MYLIGLILQSRPPSGHPKPSSLSCGKFLSTGSLILQPSRLAGGSGALSLLFGMVFCYRSVRLRRGSCLQRLVHENLFRKISVLRGEHRRTAFLNRRTTLCSRGAGDFGFQLTVEEEQELVTALHD